MIDENNLLKKLVSSKLSDMIGECPSFYKAIKPEFITDEMTMRYLSRRSILSLCDCPPSFFAKEENLQWLVREIKLEISNASDTSYSEGVYDTKAEANQS